MEKGLAKVWKQRYIAAREGQSIAPNNNWSQFAQILRQSFIDPTRARRALLELCHMHQK